MLLNRLPGPHLFVNVACLTVPVMPGHDPNTYAFHPETGHVLSSGLLERAFEWGIVDGDVYGAGINQVLRTIFFTKNGQLIGETVWGPL